MTSIGANGYCYDNAHMESFFGSLKCECRSLDQSLYPDFQGESCRCENDKTKTKNLTRLSSPYVLLQKELENWVRSAKSQSISFGTEKRPSLPSAIKILPRPDKTAKSPRPFFSCPTRFFQLTLNQYKVTLESLIRYDCLGCK